MHKYILQSNKRARGGYVGDSDRHEGRPAAATSLAHEQQQCTEPEEEGPEAEAPAVLPADSRPFSQSSTMDFLGRPEGSQCAELPLHQPVDVL